MGDSNKNKNKTIKKMYKYIKHFLQVSDSITMFLLSCNDDIC